MENQNRESLESAFISRSSLKDTPRVESISKEVDAGTRHYYDEESGNVSFLSYSVRVYNCPQCSATILLEYLDRDGCSSSDRDFVECPQCERNTVTINSAGAPVITLLSSRHEGAAIIEDFEALNDDR